MIKLLGYGLECNVYLLIDEKNALIDAGTGFENASLIKEVKKYTSTVHYIILTHEHFDHAGGAPALKRYFNSKIAMHRDGSAILENGDDVFSHMFGTSQEKAKVDIKLEDGDVIKLGKMVLHTIHTPGHSPGSICLYEPHFKILFSGDTVFLYGGIGRTDLYGGSPLLLKKSLEKLSEIDVKELYPGHGEYTNENGKLHIKMALRNYSSMISL